MKVAFFTLGCKVNQNETGSIQAAFIRKGFEVVGFHNVADVYVINTCAVTAQSDKKSRQMVRRARRTNGEAVICVCGCSSEANKNEGFSQADIVIGSSDKKSILERVEKFLRDKNKYIFNESIHHIKEFEHLEVHSFKGKTRATIKVEDGCENFCAYCIIPYVRGKIRSKPLATVIEDIKKIAENGYTEIVLTGIHLASYGKDLEKGDLITLLEETAKIEGIKRIRLGSLEPTYLTMDIVHRLKNITSLCPHFHLSLQSGCDETLQRMRRKYLTADYEKEVALLREHFEGCAITTDVIVGFPAETDEEFNLSKAFFEKMRFSEAHIFTYSRRKGTLADTMENQIDEAVKIKRAKELLAIEKKSANVFLSSFLGQTKEILFENTYKNGFYEGFTREYVRVLVKSDVDLRGKLLPVTILSAEDDHCIGQII